MSDRKRIQLYPGDILEITGPLNLKTDSGPELLQALKLAEAALSDIGDADRELGDDLAWCERRAAEPLQIVRAAIAKAEGVE